MERDFSSSLFSRAANASPLKKREKWRTRRTSCMRELVSASFRHTFANYHLRNGRDVATVSQWLGHSDLQTTSIYLKAVKNQSVETQAGVDSTFEGIETGLGS